MDRIRQIGRCKSVSVFQDARQGLQLLGADCGILRGIPRRLDRMPHVSGVLAEVISNNDQRFNEIGIVFACNEPSNISRNEGEHRVVFVPNCVPGLVEG